MISEESRQKTVQPTPNRGGKSWGSGVIRRTGVWPESGLLDQRRRSEEERKQTVGRGRGLPARRRGPSAALTHQAKRA